MDEIVREGEKLSAAKNVWIATGAWCSFGTIPIREKRAEIVDLDKRDRSFVQPREASDSER